MSTDYKKLADEFRLRLRNIGLDAEFMEIPLPRVRELANAIDALLAERDSALDDHARRYNELLVSEQENQRLRAKLAKATEALTAINEYRPPDYEEEPYVSIASFCKTKARAALAAIKETTNAKP